MFFAPPPAAKSWWRAWSVAFGHFAIRIFGGCNLSHCRVAVVYDVPFRVTMRRFLKLGLQVTVVTRGNETAVAAAHTHAREAHYSWMTIAVVRATPSRGSSTNWAVTGFHQGGLREPAFWAVLLTLSTDILKVVNHWNFVCFAVSK